MDIEMEMAMLGIENPVEIPNKSTFKINEVCALTGVKSYVLRFWESEFEEISPLPSSSGQKLYERKDIEAILLIKKLLFEDKLTIERARVEIKKLLPERKLIDSIYEDARVSMLENMETSLADSTNENLAANLDELHEILDEKNVDNFSHKYDVKKLAPEVIQTLKEKFLNASESTLQDLENSKEAQLQVEETQGLVQAPRLTVRTLNDTEFAKLLQAKSKLKEMLNILEREVSV